MDAWLHHRDADHQRGYLRVLPRAHYLGDFRRYLRGIYASGSEFHDVVSAGQADGSAYSSTRMGYGLHLSDLFRAGHSLRLHH